ncbi:MAG: LuxR C-terminal-related transcriptional regulator [Streptosporangiaceae bacterium]
MGRPELIEYLAAHVATKLVLVDAPAGFGKTTLVAQWRASDTERRPFAWVSLDPADNDPGRLWWHVVCALQRACPSFHGAGILGALRVQAPEMAGTVLPMLANALAELRAPVILVLDDYHLITNQACHEQLELLLLHLPLPAQLVLTSRADPPLRLGRLRAAGQLLDIRAGQLQLTTAHVAALVHAVSGVQLKGPDLADLVARTEGWPAGVYLAALSLRGHPSPPAFIAQFSGDNRFIGDFLAEEVLSRQPPEVQRFLVRTSVLGRFSAPLGTAVSEVPNAAGLLDRLERENLFLVPLDETRQWFRYHHLFGQVLRSQLARAEPDLVPALHQRASAWHQLHGSADEAIEHAMASGDVRLAVDLIAGCWLSYVNSGQAATVGKWIRALGESRIAASPRAAHCAAWAAAMSGDQQSARRWLPVIETGADDGPLPDGMRSLRFSAALLRAAYGFDGLLVMRESAAAAARLERDPTSPWYALARAAFGYSRYLSGQPEAAARPLEEAVRSEASLPLTRIVATATLSLMAVDEGRLPRARELMHNALDLARRDELAPTPSASMAHIAAGTVYAAQGRLDQARGELEQALRSRRGIAGSSPWPTFEATVLLGRVVLDQGDRARAEQLADEARDVLTELPDGAQAQLARLEALERQLAGPRRAASLAEPLTEREEAVLRLFDGDRSLRKIAKELYVSLNTVKTHTQSIYRKLGVSDRQDAVARGRELGLVGRSRGRVPAGER